MLPLLLLLATTLSRSHLNNTHRGRFKLATGSRVRWQEPEVGRLCRRRRRRMHDDESYCH